MPHIIDTIKSNAESFDVNFIQRKTQSVYCSSETIIYDYLVMKALTTQDLEIIIITNGKNDYKLTKNSVLYVLASGGLIDKIVKHSLSDQVKFKNGSKIHIMNYDRILKPGASNRKVDLLYIRNTAISRLYYTYSVSNFTDLLGSNARIIYNFDL